MVCGALDYNLPSTPTPSVVKYPIDNYISSHTISLSHAAFIANAMQTQDPKTFAQAVLNENWVAGMNKKLDALKRNHTWTLFLPPGKKTIGCWVTKLSIMLMIRSKDIKLVWL